MKEIKLQDYLIDGIQQDVADAIGIKQGAVSHMLRSGREIWLVLNAKGRIVRAKEIRWLKQ